jgi:hypothetical protein
MLPWAAGWLETGALVALLSISTLAAASKLFVETSGSVAAQLGLGNLAAAVPNWAAAGVWITGDHRFPLTAHKTVTYACIVLALVLGGIGVAHALRRRRWTLLWLALAGAISLLYVAERYPAWIQFKAECVTSPIALLLAFAGAAAIFQARRLRGLRFVGLLGALVLAAAVLWGNALAYHDTTIAPYPRLHELEVIGQHFAGDGPTLSPSWDEYAEYFLRSMNAEVPPDITYIAPRPGIFLPGQVIYNFDLDQIQLNNVEYFRYLVLRRSPVASRPPSNFVLVERTAFYEVWKRVGNGSSIVLHSPLSGSPTERTASFCRIESRQAKAALKGQVAGARIAYVRTPAAVTLGAAQLSHSATLKVTGDQFIAYGPARAQGAFTVTHAGRWTFWLGGSIERPVRLLVDGRTLGTVAYEASYPGQYVIAGMRRLRAGVHTVELLRGGGSLHPASGNGTDTTNRLIGPLVAMGTPPEEDQPVQTAPFSQLPAICRAHVGLDWLEVLRPAR